MKKTIASFLIMLVITLPIFVSAQLSNVQVYNKDYVENYRAFDNDRLIVTAYVNYASDDEITHNQVLVEDENFTECVKMQLPATGYKCTYIGSVGTVPEAKRYPLTVTFKDDNEVSIQNVPKYVIIDNKIPVVTLNDVSYDAGKVSVDYSIIDDACDGSGCTGCSGIGSVKVYEAATLLGELLLNTSCSYSNVSNFTLSGSGLKSIRVEAFDRVGNMGLAAQSLEVDATAPAIESFKLMRGGSELEYISPALGYTADIHITLVEANLSYVRVDLSKVHYHPAITQGTVALDAKDDCEEKEGKITCVAKNVKIASTSPEISINVEAVDTSGNMANRTLTYALEFDDAAPKVKFVGTDKVFNEKSYIRKGLNKIVVELEEAGSGFNTNYNYNGNPGKAVVVDISGIAGVSKKVAMYNCSASGNIWSCFGYVEIDDARSGSIFVDSLYTYDDAGNRVEGVGSTQVILDDDAPVVNSILVFGREFSYATVTGDSLFYLANVSDDTPVKAYADFSNVVLESDRDNLTVECTGSDTYLCAYGGIGTIKTGPLTDMPITVRFEDLVGNSVVNQTIHNILFEEEQITNYWTVDGVEVMPSALDPDIASQISTIAYAKVNLKTTWPGTKPLTQEVTCADYVDPKTTGVTVMSGGFAGTEVVYGNPTVVGAASTTPYVRIILGQSSFTNKSGIRLNCTLTTVSETPLGKLTKPEQDSFDVLIPLTRPTRGTVSTEMRDRLREVVDDSILEWSDKLEGLRKIFNMLTKICNILGLITRLRTIFSGITAAFDRLRPLPNGQMPANRMQNIHNALHSQHQIGMFKPLYKLCLFASCGKGGKGAIWGGWYQNVVSKFKAPIPFLGAGTQRVSGNENAKSDASLKDEYSGMSGSIWPEDPSDNLYLSLMTGCVPGIIRGIEQLKGVKCGYLKCIMQDYPAGIMDLQSCDAVSSYQECMITGAWLFDLFPFSDMFKQFGNVLKGYLDNPVSLVFGLAARYCTIHYNPLTNQPSTLCSLSLMLPELAKIIEDLKGAKDFDLDLTPEEDSACDSLIEEAKKFTN